MSEALEMMLTTAKQTVADYEAQCHRCRAGFPNECVTGFDPTVTCGEVKVAPAEYSVALIRVDKLESLLGKAAPRKVPKPEKVGWSEDVGSPPAPQFESGYIHPDAWRFDKNIGDFTDPGSTGRKLAKRLYPLEGAGLVCEWARKRVLGLPGGPMVGCIGNPATDWHHGPDKNTLNNEKVSFGIGTAENMHLICSSCHNKAHAQIDPHYPPYDRFEQQSTPWLPLPGDWGPITFEDADIEELLAEERRRLESEQRRGRTTRGRNQKPSQVDASVIESED